MYFTTATSLGYDNFYLLFVSEAVNSMYSSLSYTYMKLNL